MNSSTITKTCIKCGQIKHLDKFCKRQNICKECRILYNKTYYQAHKRQAIKYQREYRLDHSEQVVKNYKKYYQNHKEEAKKYYQNHKEELKKYYQNHKGELIKRQKEFSQTPKGKLAAYKHKAKRRRSLGFNPLNKPFSSSVWHHINDQDVVAIPKEVHVKFASGPNRVRHRRRIWQYYGRSIENMMNNRSLDNMINSQDQLSK